MGLNSGWIEDFSLSNKMAPTWCRNLIWVGLVLRTNMGWVGLEISQSKGCAMIYTLHSLGWIRDYYKNKRESST